MLFSIEMYLLIYAVYFPIQLDSRKYNNISNQTQRYNNTL